MLVASLPSRIARSVLALVVALPLALSAAQPAAAQEPEFFDTPWAYNQWTYGRVMDMSQLRYCVDTRDPDWEVAAAIADTIARGLLLEPQRYVVDIPVTVADDITRIYAVMLQNCDLFMGFKLIPEGYESWVTLTHAYYQTQYAYVAANPAYTALADVPRDRPIGATVGSTAHLNLLAYLRTAGQTARWPIFPMANDTQALDALLAGTVDVALIWAPTLWARQQADPAYAALRIIAPNPAQPVTIGVGGILLADQIFLRSAIDEAIAALTADGTFTELLEFYGFPATAAP